MTDNIFERASQVKLRFTLGKGTYSVEDLWDLDIEILDAGAVALVKKLESGTLSFIPNTTKRTSSKELLTLEILKHIIVKRTEEAEAAKARAEKRNKLARLEELAAQKADESFSKKSLDEIMTEIAQLKSEL